MKVKTTAAPDKKQMKSKLNLNKLRMLIASRSYTLPRPLPRTKPKRKERTANFDFAALLIAKDTHESS